MKRPFAQEYLICLIFLFIFMFLLNCGTKHLQELSSYKEREQTLGIVQKEIRKGQDQASVAESLGSPNIVTSDGEGLETWIYDKISSEVSYSTSTGSLLFFVSKQSGAASSTRKTLTVIIKFRNNLVDSYSYHASTF